MNADMETDLVGIDDEFISIPEGIDIDEELQEAEKPVHKKTEDDISKYLLFPNSVLSDYRDSLMNKVEDEGVRAEKRGKTVDQKWREEQFYKLATDTAKDQKSVTLENKWDHFPDIMAEYTYGTYGIGDLLDDPNISEIYIDGFDRIRVKRRDGNISKKPPIAENKEALMLMVQNWVRASGSNKTFDEGSPEVNIKLPNGDRMHAIALGPDGVNVTIRRHDFSLNKLSQLEQLGTLTTKTRRFLEAAVKAKLNIVVVGGTGAGKTTILRCLLNNVGATERVITAEDTEEIGFKYYAPEKWCVSLMSREPNLEGEGGIPLKNIVIASLRMDPTRVVVGEVRSSEALPMLMAMSQGNDGSMCTIHGQSATNAVQRLRTYLMSFCEVPTTESCMSMIGEAVNVIVFMKRVHRLPQVYEVVTVTPSLDPSSGMVATTDVLEWDREKDEATPSNHPIPQEYMVRLREVGWSGWDDPIDIGEDIVD